MNDDAGEWEWQYAAQGSDGRVWPWGSTDDNETNGGYVHRPNVSHETVLPNPPAVDAYPAGASPFGVQAMVASVHEWTDEYTDAHMSRAVLRGGAHWCPLPQPAVMYDYFFNYTTGVGYTDGAPNWWVVYIACPPWFFVFDDMHRACFIMDCQVFSKCRRPD